MIPGRLYKMIYTATFYHGDAVELVVNNTLKSMKVVTLSKDSIVMPLYVHRNNGMEWWAFMSAHGVISDGFPFKIKLSDEFKEIE